MHHRNGSWVTGHYRNGSWVKGHRRSGTDVSDHQSKIGRRKSSASVEEIDGYGSFTFLTECWWCGESVFFHRNANGGCVLFDSLGAPWEVHECWVLNMYGRSSVAQYFVVSYAQSIIKIQKTFDYIDSPIGGNEITFDGYFIGKRGDREILCNDLEFVEFTIRDFSGSYYKIIIPSKYRRKLKWISMVSVTAKWAQRGSTFVLFATSLSACGPNDESYVREFELNIEEVVSAQWVSRKLKR